MGIRSRNYRPGGCARLSPSCCQPRLINLALQERETGSYAELGPIVHSWPHPGLGWGPSVHSWPDRGALTADQEWARLKLKIEIDVIR
jgi:hypothetical protein